MREIHEHYMRLALEEAAKSKTEGNVAVGSVIVRSGEVLARGRNLVTTHHDPTAHAETVALREAGEVLKGVTFSECELYTSVEPCPMCCGAILVSGLRTLIIGARLEHSQSRWGDYAVEKLVALTGRGDTLDVVTGVLTQECINMWLT